MRNLNEQERQSVIQPLIRWLRGNNYSYSIGRYGEPIQVSPHDKAYQKQLKALQAKIDYLKR